MKILHSHLFPELPNEFPDELLSEEWAQKIHSQTLKRLNERGGMSVLELLINLKRQEWNQSPKSITQAEVSELKSFLTNH